MFQTCVPFFFALVVVAERPKKKKKKIQLGCFNDTGNTTCEKNVSGNWSVSRVR